MFLNKFDPLTREFTTTVNAPVNPKQPSKFLAVLNSTADSLPELSEHQTAIRSVDDTKWEVVEDYRGNAWNKETKEQVQITELGALNASLTKLEPSEFDFWQDNKWIEDKDALLTDLKIKAIAKVTVFANQCRRQIAGDVDHLETAEWSEKRLRALRIFNDEALPGDVEKVETEVLYRGKGETVTELVAKIIDNANRYENASIIITGLTAFATDAINNATTNEEIETLLVSLKDKALLELARL
ncbi:hypothetical protein WN093_04540 [Gammaproteobacteria bacterium AS21]